MAWVNKHLKEREMKVENLSKDFQNGVILINLLESLSGQQVKTYYREPNRLYQYLENLEVAVKFMHYLALPIMAAPQGNLFLFFKFFSPLLSRSWILINYYFLA